MLVVVVLELFVFFKQKTAYEMRIIDWSSDVFSSDLPDTATLSAATSGDGTKLYVSLDGTTWTEVAELDDDDGLTDLPSGDQTTYETTHMGSGDFKEFKKNARREGTETDITGNYELGSTNETNRKSTRLNSSQ